jgi:hypothetical protein
VLRALLDQIAKGRTVTIAPVAGFPDMVSVSITSGTTTVTDSTCDGDEATVRRLIRKLAAELGG